MNGIGKVFDPFYDFGRRKLDLPVKVIDELIKENATATLNGRTIEFTVDGVRRAYAHIGLGHAKHATKWVNQFNAKV